jgi:hypothetical protein
MAQSQAVAGLLEELGLGTVNEQAAYEAGLGSQVDYGSGSNATLAAVGQQLGRNAAPAIGGLIGGLRGLKKDESGARQGFLGGFTQTVQDQRDAAVARGQGITLEEYRVRKASRSAIGKITQESTGDPIKDQQAFLDKVIATANSTGDAQLVAKAMQKKAALNIQALELRKAEVGAEEAEREHAQQSIEDARSNTRTEPVVPNGADSRTRDFRPSHALYRDDTDDYLVTHPDGSQEILKHITPYDPKVNGFMASGGKVSDKPLTEAIAQSGGTKSFAAKKQGVADMETTAELTGTVTDMFIAHNDPQALLSWFGKGAQTADKGIRFVESTGRALWKESGDGRYVSPDTGKEFRNDQYVYRGSLTNKEQQKQQFFRDAKKYINENGGIDNLIPLHLRDTIAEVANGAALYEALIMEMAFMDARMQEPSNRGLSDKDIDAALKRIGAFSANPVTFLDRQIWLQERSLNRLNRLGEEYTDTQANNKEALIKVTYNEEHVNRVRNQLVGNLTKMKNARENIVSKQRHEEGADSVGYTPSTAPPANETREERKARLLGQ